MPPPSHPVDKRHDRPDSGSLLDFLFGQEDMIEAIQIPGAEVYYDEHFLKPEEVTELFNTLLSKCAWERRWISFGHAVPRDEAYYGDPRADYTYSRREYTPLPWLSELLLLKARIEEATPDRAYANLSLPKLGYNAAICIAMEMTASGSMQTLNQRWGL